MHGSLLSDLEPMPELNKIRIAFGKAFIACGQLYP
jgi:hypothetical protein